MSDARASYLSHLQDALRIERMKATCGKDWYFLVTDTLDVDERTVRRWLAGETSPEAHQLLLLFRMFGPEFESAIKGEPKPTTPHDALLREFAEFMRTRGMP